jgi:hypothetical protein
MSIKKVRRNLNLTNCHPFDIFAEATNRCDKIAAVAQLLATCQTQRLRTETISVAGALIMDEAAQLRRNLNTLGEGASSKKSK